MSDPVLIERTGDIVVWTLNNPEARNPLSESDTVEAIEDAVHAVNRDSTVRVAILTGAGTAFSSGGNIKHMHDRAGMFGGAPADLRQGYRHGIQRIPKALYHCEIPTIAAVNGPAIGAGCDLALMCDMRIAACTAIFAESFVKVGLIPGDGGAMATPPCDRHGTSQRDGIHRCGDRCGYGIGVGDGFHRRAGRPTSRNRTRTGRPGGGQPTGCPADDQKATA